MTFLLDCNAGTEAAASIIFVATKVCLSRQNFCRDKVMFVTKNICRHKRRVLSRQKTCFFATKLILVAAPAKVVSRQTYFCRNKRQVLFRQNFCLSRQAYFCREKRRVLSRQIRICRDKHVFVATKLRLAAAPANDIVGHVPLARSTALMTGTSLVFGVGALV